MGEGFLDDRGKDDMVEGLGENEDGRGEGDCNVARCGGEESFLSSAKSGRAHTARVY